MFAALSESAGGPPQKTLGQLVPGPLTKSATMCEAGRSPEISGRQRRPWTSDAEPALHGRGGGVGLSVPTPCRQTCTDAPTPRRQTCVRLGPASAGLFVGEWVCFFCGEMLLRHQSNWALG